MSNESLQYTGYLLIITGILILIASLMFRHKAANSKYSKADTRRLITVGPFPLTFGPFKSHDSLKMVQFTALFVVIIFVVWLFFLNH